MFEVIPNWHPLFVHFTVALFSLSVIFFIIQKPLAETNFGDNLLVFAKYSLWLGVFFSLITLVAGWDAYNTVDHDTPSHAAMTDHKNWGFATVGLFFVAAIWWKVVDSIHESASVIFLICLIVGGGLLVTTGHKGSQLVYKYGLGVQSLPAKDDHKASGGHSHSHGAGEAGDGHSSASDDSHNDSHDDSHSRSHGHDDSEVTSHGHGEDSAEMPSAEGMDMGDLTMPESSKTDAVMLNPVVDKPKVEKYEDGTVREHLPEVQLELQE